MHVLCVRCEGSYWSSAAGGDSAGAAADPGEEAGRGTAARVSSPIKRVPGAQVPARCTLTKVYSSVYFSEIYLTWHLSNLTYTKKRSKYVWACAPGIRVVIIIRYEALEHIFCTELTQKTQVKKKPKLQMLHV